VHAASTNEPAAEKVAKIMTKLGVEGVGTRGQFYDKIKTIIVGVCMFKMAQGLYWHYYPQGDGHFDLIFSFGRDMGFEGLSYYSD
jgi:hypothetical protein